MIITILLSVVLICATIGLFKSIQESIKLAKNGKS